jgi:hypothetical protein
LGAIKRLNLAFLVDAKLENAFWAGSYKARFPRNSGERLGETREQRTNVLALVKRGDNDSKLYGAEAWTLRVAGGGSSGAKSGSGLALSHFVAGLTALLSARRR